MLPALALSPNRCLTCLIDRLTWHSPPSSATIVHPQHEPSCSAASCRSLLGRRAWGLTVGVATTGRSPHPPTRRATQRADWCLFSPILVARCQAPCLQEARPMSRAATWSVGMASQALVVPSPSQLRLTQGDGTSGGCRERCGGFVTGGEHTRRPPPPPFRSRSCLCCSTHALIPHLLHTRLRESHGTKEPSRWQVAEELLQPFVPDSHPAPPLESVSGAATTSGRASNGRYASMSWPAPPSS